MSGLSNADEDWEIVERPSVIDTAETIQQK